MDKEDEADNDESGEDYVIQHDGDGFDASVSISQVYDISILDQILGGDVPTNVEEELAIASGQGNNDAWDPTTLMKAHGVL